MGVSLALVLLLEVLVRLVVVLHPRVVVVVVVCGHQVGPLLGLSVVVDHVVMGVVVNHLVVLMSIGHGFHLLGRTPTRPRFGQSQLVEVGTVGEE